MARGIAACGWDLIGLSTPRGELEGRVGRALVTNTRSVGLVGKKDGYRTRKNGRQPYLPRNNTRVIIDSAIRTIKTPQSRKPSPQITPPTYPRTLKSRNHLKRLRDPMIHRGLHLPLQHQPPRRPHIRHETEEIERRLQHAHPPRPGLYQCPFHQHIYSQSNQPQHKP